MKYDTIKQLAKQVNIVDYLASLGVKPNRARGTKYLYSAPYREDKNPSMLVDSKENVFTDLGGQGNKGDIITLAQLIHKIDFKEAVNILSTTIYPSFSFIKQQKPNHHGITLLKVKELENKALIEYLASRKIPFEIGEKYLREAYFLLRGKARGRKNPYFALLFRNEAGGGELRSKYFKGGIAHKSYTFIEGESATQVNIFEGFMDFLTSLAIKGSPRPSYNTIVLNSIAMLPKALPRLRNYPQINCFLDNDGGGDEATNEIQKVIQAKVVDYRSRYTGYKDLSEWWEHLP